MSLASWKKEFYPVTAKEASTSDKKAIAHSLRKWEGLLKKNLKKHKCRLYGGGVSNDDEYGDIHINADTCALCERHLVGPYVVSMCEGCPLYTQLGDCCAESGQPYDIFDRQDNPLPMIRALRTLAKSSSPKGRQGGEKHETKDS